VLIELLRAAGVVDGVHGCMGLVVTATTPAEHITGATHVNFFLLLDFLLRFSRFCTTRAATAATATATTTTNTDTSESSFASSQNLVNTLEKTFG
jgi:hypothetical protein